MAAARSGDATTMIGPPSTETIATSADRSSLMTWFGSVLAERVLAASVPQTSRADFVGGGGVVLRRTERSL
jgi:hypothetical protein